MRKIRDWERRLKASQLFETNPQAGEAPKVALGTPSIGDKTSIAKGNSPQPTIRGQTPEYGEPHRATYAPQQQAPIQQQPYVANRFAPQPQQQPAYSQQQQPVQQASYAQPVYPQQQAAPPRFVPPYSEPQPQFQQPQPAYPQQQPTQNP
jgi:hypothetical protein